MKVSGRVDLGGHPLELPAGRADAQGAAWLRPACPEVFHDFGGVLVQAPGQGVEKRRQHLGPGHRAAGRLPKGYGESSQFPGKIPGLLREIESKTKDGEGQAGGTGDGLNEKSGQFPIFMQDIVGPFQAGFESGEGVDGIRCGQGAEDGKQRQVRRGRLQQDRAPKTEGTIGDPVMALAAPAGGLDFRSPNGRGFPGFAGKVLSGAGFRDDVDFAPEGVAGRKKSVDERGVERIGPSRWGGLGLRGRNCRRS